MTMEPIPVIRAAYLNLFLNALGEPARKDSAFLQQANLPANLADKPDAYVPLKTAWLFARWAAQRSGIEAFGLTSVSGLQVSHLGAELRSALQCAPSLGHALERFARLADREQSNVRYRIERKGDEVRIVSSADAVPLAGVDNLGEWLRIMPLMTVIRYFTGNEWLPDVIALQAQREPGQSVCQTFPGTRILAGRAETGIIFPAALLSLATTRNCPRHGVPLAPGTRAAATGPANWDFCVSLREILQAYLDKGYPDINFVAGIVGCSARTLQRRLREFGLSYTDVVQQARFEVAKALLKDPDVKMIDTALAVGYHDPAHFSRAFKRMTGISPKQYRTLSSA